jgi:hypothetical protein
MVCEVDSETWLRLDSVFSQKNESGSGDSEPPIKPVGSYAIAPKLSVTRHVDHRDIDRRNDEQKDDDGVSLEESGDAPCESDYRAEQIRSSSDGPEQGELWRLSPRSSRVTGMKTTPNCSLGTAPVTGLITHSSDEPSARGDPLINVPANIAHHRTSKLAIASLVLALSFVFSWLGIALGIVSLVRILNPLNRLSGIEYAVSAIMLGLAGLVAWYLILLFWN